MNQRIETVKDAKVGDAVANIHAETVVNNYVQPTGSIATVVAVPIGTTLAVVKFNGSGITSTLSFDKLVPVTDCSLATTFDGSQVELGDVVSTVTLLNDANGREIEVGTAFTIQRVINSSTVLLYDFTNDLPAVISSGVLVNFAAISPNNKATKRDLAIFIIAARHNMTRGWLEGLVDDEDDGDLVAQVKGLMHKNIKAALRTLAEDAGARRAEFLNDQINKRVDGFVYGDRVKVLGSGSSEYVEGTVIARKNNIEDNDVSHYHIYLDELRIIDPTTSKVVGVDAIATAVFKDEGERELRLANGETAKVGDVVAFDTLIEHAGVEYPAGHFATVVSCPNSADVCLEVMPIGATKGVVLAYSHELRTTPEKVTVSTKDLAILAVEKNAYKKTVDSFRALVGNVKAQEALDILKALVDGAEDFEKKTGRSIKDDSIAGLFIVGRRALTASVKRDDLKAAELKVEEAVLDIVNGTVGQDKE